MDASTQIIPWKPGTHFKVNLPEAFSTYFCTVMQFQCAWAGSLSDQSKRAKLMHSRFKHRLCLWDLPVDNSKLEAPRIYSVYFRSLAYFRSCTLLANVYRTTGSIYLESILTSNIWYRLSGVRWEFNECEFHESEKCLPFMPLSNFYFMNMTS